MQTQDQSPGKTATTKVKFERPKQLIHAAYQEILLADLGTKPRLKKPGRFGTFLSAHFEYSNLDDRPFEATVDFLQGEFYRTIVDDKQPGTAIRKLKVFSKAAAISFKLETGSHMKDYLIKQLLNRCYYQSMGSWKETTKKVEKDKKKEEDSESRSGNANNTDREFVFQASGNSESPYLGYFDRATRVLTVWDSTLCFAYLEGDHMKAATVAASRSVQEVELDLHNLEVPFLGGEWIE